MRLRLTMAFRRADNRRMLRIARQSLLRHLGICLAVVGAGLVVLAGLAIGNLRAEAQERRAAQITFLQVAEDSHHLNALVLTSLARGRADASTFTAVDASDR